VHKNSDFKAKYIAKRVHKASHELQMLQYLHSRPSPSPYIIALDKHLVVDTATYLIFPELKRIYERTVVHRRIKEPCQSLIKGVAYLHANGVAHLDLQMDNLVYDAAGTLKIIDFDTAVRVRDEEQEVVGYRGTLTWTAPEVGDQDGPEQSYSAIKADRWACGRLLEVFLRYESASDLSDFAEQLMADDPNERPSLVQWCDLQLRERQIDSEDCEGREDDRDNDNPRSLSRRDSFEESDVLAPLATIGSLF
jgi:serine/threonine protein kinase